MRNVIALKTSSVENEFCEMCHAGGWRFDGFKVVKDSQRVQ